jgi:antitoxin Phd
MMHIWQLQEAKAQFSHVVKMAKTQGPQSVTVRGIEEIIIIAKTDFDRLTKPKSNSIFKFFQNSPLRGMDLDFSRATQERSRDIEL